MFYTNTYIRLEEQESPEGVFRGATIGERWRGNRWFCLSAPRKAGRYIHLWRPDLTIRRDSDCSDHIWRIQKPKQRDSAIYLLLTRRPSQTQRTYADGLVLALEGQPLDLLDYSYTRGRQRSFWCAALLRAHPGDIFATIAGKDLNASHFYIVDRDQIVEASPSHVMTTYAGIRRTIGLSPLDISQSKWSLVFDHNYGRILHL